MISRRVFLALSGAALFAPSFSWADDKFPPVLDHIILGCNDIDHGIKFVEERTGVRAAIGGVHPDRGTMNALVSLGELHYLEIMAPDPNAKTIQPWAMQQLNVLKELTVPRLVTWAVHTADIEASARRLREAGVAASGPVAGSRIRPDGRVLKWKSLNLADNHRGVLPFFIEWSADSVHPSADAPAGCQLDHFSAADRSPAELSAICHRIGVNLIIEQGGNPQLRARIHGPKGALEVNS